MVMLREGRVWGRGQEEWEGAIGSCKRRGKANKILKMGDAGEVAD